MARAEIKTTYINQLESQVQSAEEKLKEAYDILLSCVTEDNVRDYHNAQVDLKTAESRLENAYKKGIFLPQIIVLPKNI